MTKQMTQSDIDRVFKKVKALFAKAERTDNDNEAQAFQAKATELMVRYAIDEAELRGKDSAATPEWTDILVEAPHAPAKSGLIVALDNAFGCKSIVAFKTSAGYHVRTVGMPSAVQAHHAMYRFLDAQRTAEAAKAKRARGAGHRDFHRSFIIGFNQQVNRRLAAARTEQMKQAAETKRESGDTSALVLVSDLKQVQAAFKNAYPSTRRSSTTSAGYGASDGIAAGRRADIGQGSVGNGGQKAISR